METYRNRELEYVSAKILIFFSPVRSYPSEIFTRGFCSHPVFLADGGPRRPRIPSKHAKLPPPRRTISYPSSIPKVGSERSRHSDTPAMAVTFTGPGARRPR